MTLRLETGQKFGKLTVITKSDNRKHYWICYCDCGRFKTILGTKINTGETKSCGCLRGRPKTAHSHKRKNKITKTRRAWLNMHSRCKSTKQSTYKYYGKRGITVCERWNKFENFFSDMGESPKDLTLERIDNDRGYFPENCKWATRKEQIYNTGIAKLRRDLASGIRFW